MEALNKLKEETYQNYIHQYPLYKDSFHDLIEKDEILYKIWYYTYLPTEEIELRKKIEKEIKEEHYHYLLQKVTREKSKNWRAYLMTMVW